MNQTRKLVPGAIFRHYKNKEYLIMGVAIHTETLDELVVYRPLYKQPKGPQFNTCRLWVRPKKMFLETIELDGKTKPRFESVSPDT